jgi:uncharacterized membrane protein YgcG
MTDNAWLVLSLLALAPVLIFNALATPELCDYPLFSTRQKIFWMLFLWLVPYAGFLLVHKKLGLGWGSGKDTGGGDTINLAGGGHDGGGGGDCGHGGSC